MFMTIPRAALGALALLLAVATINVSGARAQDATITPTVCGVGSHTACGTSPIQSCETSFHLNLNLLARGGGLTYSTTKCTESGYRTLYKDIKRTTIKPPAGAVPTCSATGPTPSMPGEDEDVELTEELCEP
jgi:hypothetical protein